MPIYKVCEKKKYAWLPKKCYGKKWCWLSPYYLVIEWNSMPIHDPARSVRKYTTQDFLMNKLQGTL